ncbi:hypothetical protein DSM25558_4366 [Agrobacterium sp. DSM 25558]|nr:hypothetical protein DSM25558_4366 [Agrobacterium sp. DSM 25558]
MWRVCDISLRNIAPNVFTTSRPKSLQNNFYSLYFIDRDGITRFLASEMRPEGVSGKWSTSAANFHANAECSVPYEAFDHFVVDIHYHYRGWTFYTRGVPMFALQYVISYPFLRIYTERMIQALFNLRPLARRDRMKVLSYILRQTIKDPKFHAHSTSVLTHFYSARWVLRKDHLELMTYYGLLLDSLKHTGDLAAGDHGGYLMKPQALNTIAAFQREERRHRDNYKIQRGIFGLTVVLTLVGIAQAVTGGYQMWATYNKPPAISDRSKGQ